MLTEMRYTVFIIGHSVFVNLLTMVRTHTCAPYALCVVGKHDFLVYGIIRDAGDDPLE